MKDLLAAELETVMAQLRREHDVLPFLGEMIGASEASLRPLPDAMLALLQSSPDFMSIRPGEPNWLMLEAPGNASAEVVIYRADANGRHYIVTGVSGDAAGS